MTHNQHLPPLPWTYAASGDGWLNIVDAEGHRLATLWGSGHRREAVAELIIEASKHVAANRRLGDFK
jgi:hypothetical protein